MKSSKCILKRTECRLGNNVLRIAGAKAIQEKGAPRNLKSYYEVDVEGPQKLRI